MREGNFRRFLKFRVDSGDLEFECTKNACYTSAEIQNNIIHCIEAQLTDKVIARVQKSGF